MFGRTVGGVSVKSAIKLPLQIMNHRLSWNPTQAQFTTLLVTTTIGVYALIAAGATLASTETTGYSSWLPKSGFAFTVDTGLALGHRLLTVVVGLLLVATLFAGLAVTLDRRARLALFGGTVTFPIQIGIGALVALTEIPYVAQVHLVVAAVVFMFLLTALGWTLEDGSATDEQKLIDTTTQTDGGHAHAEQAVQSERGKTQASGGVATRLRAYLELTKPRLMWLLCLLALAGMALATTTGQWPSGVTVAATLAGGVFAIGASGTFNHLFERDRDQQMERTADRPVATDQIPVRNAAVFATALAVLSMGVLFTFVNILATVLTFAAIIYYSVVYTVVLKPNTSWNIAIGGGSGALPALIGWAAVTGSLGLGGILLAALVVIWTPAHFYNLAIVYREDYARAGYPMFPVVAGVPAARRRILLTLGGTLLVTASLVLMTPLSWLFALTAIVAGSVFLRSVVSQCRTRTREATLQSFYASNAYLGVILLAIVVETVLVI